MVAQEWNSGNGGLATLNRSLCVALAAEGASVVCLLPSASPEECAHAAAHGVVLVEARSVLGGLPRQAMVRRPPLASGWVPDLIGGHSRFTGPEAKCLAEDFFPRAKRLQFAHIAPDEMEWCRQDRADDAGVRAEERTRLELALAADAYRAVAVGPRLHKLLRRDLSVHPGVPEPALLVPGFDPEPFRPRTPPPGEPVQILLMGRLEDFEIKGVDIAARAIGRAVSLRGGSQRPEIELLVRGAPSGESAALRDRILGLAGDIDLRVTPRCFTTDRVSLDQELMRASLVLVCSRAEAFGLVGHEAIIAGTPVLISDRCGLSSLVEHGAGSAKAAGPVVPVTRRLDEDVERWGYRIAAVLDDRAAAFRRADDLRRALAARWTWKDAAEQILGL
jgi:glycosyltransferase involved in cell wall biosynthesis